MPLVQLEAQHLWDYHLSGALRGANFLQAPDAPFPTGVSLLMEVTDLPQAQAMIAALPLVTRGLVAVEVLPLAPFTAFGALFANAPAWG